MPAAISFQSVSKTYATPTGPFQALHHIDLNVREGEFIGLLGPNGAGKTSLIGILGGLVRPSAGTVRVQGFDVQREPAQTRQRLGIVPQELVFDPFFSVRETLRFQSGYFGIRRNDDWIDALLHHLGLTDKADANMRQLSGGMKRRVMVAQALVHKPPVIVLDEPTAGVDVELRQTLWQFIGQLSREGHTVLLTTHYLEEAEALCQRIAVLRAGRLIALEETGALLSRLDQGVLQFKTAQPLPPALAAIARVTGRTVQIPTGQPQGSAHAVEGILNQLRQAGVQVQEMEIRRAHLEDVFIALMHEGGEGQQV